VNNVPKTTTYKLFFSGKTNVLVFLSVLILLNIFTVSAFAGTSANSSASVIEPTVPGETGGGVGGASYSSAKAITAFTISGQLGTTIINETTHTILLTMPYGANVTALAPIVAITGSSVSPASGVVKNFRSPQTYIVIAADSSIQNYIITVNIAPATGQETNWFTREVDRTDIVRDGKIDILDFNALMVNWGKKGVGNPADVNQDGSVDIFDFNALMVHWGKTEII
jgi:hypothetical protein